MKETPESSYKLLTELTWILFYKYYKSNIILKKASENEEFFYILLGGKILKLNIIYERESLTLEEYLIYLFKMKLIHEKQILKKCRSLNSFYSDIDGDNLHKFCKENPQFNFEKLKEIAKQEIINLGFKIDDFQEEKIKLNSIDNYIKIASVKKHIKLFTDGIKATPRFYIGKYVKSGYITKGQLIGNLTRELTSDNSTYICIDNCDIVLINKKVSNIKNLCKLIEEKKIRIFSEFKKDFFILNQIPENVFFKEIVPYFEYKQFHQGDKIFIQGSLYEGIYLIKQGQVDIYLKSNINDLGKYISNIKYSLCCFKEYISIMNLKKNNSPNIEILARPKIINDKTNLTKEKCDILNEINKYEVLTIPEYSIFGTNELYDYKTGLYNFTAECVSKEAIIYFLPKKYFYPLLIKEKPIYMALVEIVESKAKYIIGKLKHHIKSFEAVINKNIKKIENNKLNTLNPKDLTYSTFLNSLKSFTRNNLTINEKTLQSTKIDSSLEFLPMIRSKKLLLKKENKKKKDILAQTINSFYFNDKNDKKNKTITENINLNKYKKINLRVICHPKFSDIYNKKAKSYGGKNKIIKNYKISLPSNFPFNVQNSYYTSFYPKEKTIV